MTRLRNVRLNLSTYIIGAGLSFVMNGSRAAIAQSSTLFVGSYLNGAVVSFNGSTGAFLSNFVPSGSGGLEHTQGIKFGPDGNLYVVSQYSGAVLRYNGTTGAFLDVFVAPPTGDTNDAGGQGLTFGPDGNLYVSRTFANQVWRYSGSTGAYIDVFASGGGLSFPTDLTFGPDGNLYICSHGTAQVLRYDGSTGALINVFAEASDLVELTFGLDGNLYVSGYDGNDVLRFDGKTGSPLPSLGNTGAEFVAAGLGGLSRADGLVFGLDGNLYVSSVYTDQVLRYNGITGQYLDVFASAGDLQEPNYLAFNPSLPTDVSRLVQATSSSLVYNSGTELYTGTLTLKNIGSLTLDGPLYAALIDLTHGVTLANAAGAYDGVPYLTANISTLAPGATVTLPLRFRNPSNGPIAYTVRTYATGY